MASGSHPFEVRRVVTGDDGGRGVFVSDGVPPVTVASSHGHGLSELVWFDAPPGGAGDGGEPSAASRGAFPSGGAAVCRLIRFPGAAAGAPVAETWLRVQGDEPERPGMHRTETLDLMVVLDGEIVLGLDDAEYPLRPGDAVVQRATRHRWRVVGERPCTFMSVLLSAVPGAKEPSASAFRTQVAAEGDDPGAGRLLVTGSDAVGRSVVTVFGPPSPAFPPGGVGVSDLWQTGGPVADTAQGGTAAEEVPWSLEPYGRGVAMRRVEFAAGHDPGEAGWHTTDTIDVGVVVSGALLLELRVQDGTETTARTELRRGDVVVQRGTAHRWRAVGDEPAVLVAVMFALSAARSSGQSSTLSPAISDEGREDARD